MGPDTHAVAELTSCLQRLLIEETDTGSLAQHRPHFDFRTLMSMSVCERHGLAAISQLEQIESDVLLAFGDLRVCQKMDRVVAVDARLFGHKVFFPSLASVFAGYANRKSVQLLEEQSLVSRGGNFHMELRELLHCAYLPWAETEDIKRRALALLRRTFHVDAQLVSLVGSDIRILHPNPDAQRTLDTVEWACRSEKSGDYGRILLEYVGRLRVFKAELAAAIETVATSNSFWMCLSSVRRSGAVERETSRVLRLPVESLVPLVARTNLGELSRLVGCDPACVQPLLNEVFGLFVSTRLTPSPSTSLAQAQPPPLRTGPFWDFVRSLPAHAFNSEIVVRVSSLDAKARDGLKRLSECHAFCRLTKRGGFRVFAINGPDLATAMSSGLRV